MKFFRVIIRYAEVFALTFKKNIIAFIVISVLGTLSHFVYEWSGDNSFLGLFFPVNESVWEHLKLLFFPTLIYSLAEYLLTKEKPKNYLSALAISIFCGIFTIIAIYYIANGIIGYDVEFINIASYYVGVIVMLCKKNKILSNGKYYSKMANLIFGIILALTALLFMVWSYNPPSIGIFTPPMPV